LPADENGVDRMSAQDEMTCRELVEVLTDYLEGALASEDRQRLEEHLDACPYCAEYVEQMRLTIDSLGGISEESIAPEKREELLAAFRGWRER
jgi:anti-sigma factor RsiW